MSNKYKNKVILAPMVRIGTLPMRLLSLEYGSDLVYTEEIVDWKILKTVRTENGLLGTVDFSLSDGTVVFRTCQQERCKVVFQLGTSDANRALAAARIVENDVSGIDINMGCPKAFSIKGGMGCALLTQPEKVRQILTLLVEELAIPVTCKIRVLPLIKDTLTLVRLIESTGVAALAVHGRLKDERPQHKNRNHEIKRIADAVDIPVIANGGSMEIESFEDIEKFRLSTGASSVMLARQAQWNCSIFRPEGIFNVCDVIRSYISYAIRYGNDSTNTKCCILHMGTNKDMGGEGMQRTLPAKSDAELCAAWGMQAEYEQLSVEMNERAILLHRSEEGPIQMVKRWKSDDGFPVSQLCVRLDNRWRLSSPTPKQQLYEWCQRTRLHPPSYTTVESEDRTFRCRVLVDGKCYTYQYREKRKQHAEQAAAMACLTLLSELNSDSPVSD